MKHNSTLLEIIMTRRSIRDFQEGDVPPEDVERILRAGIMAPSPGNSQPWRFHVIRGKTKERFVGMLKSAQITPPSEVAKGAKTIPPSWRHLLVKGLETVPVVVVVEHSVSINRDNIFSLGSLLETAASVENMLLAVHSLGYGSVWLGFPPILKAAKEVLGITGEVVCVLPIGHPANHQKEYFDRSRKPVEEIAEFYN
jgi:nitroreductase